SRRSRPFRQSRDHTRLRSDPLARPIAVGTPITGRPPHRTVRAAFLYTAPTSDVGRLASRPSVRAPAPVTRFPGTGSGTCGIGSRSCVAKTGSRRGSVADEPTLHPVYQ